MFERDGTLINKKFREYFLPTLLVNITLALAVATDSVLVGNILGEKTLSVVTLAGPVIFCLNAFFLLFVTGGITCAAIAKGQRDEKKVSKIFTMSITFGLVAMSLLSLLIWKFLPEISFALSRSDEEIAGMISQYLLLYLFVGPLMMIAGISHFIRTDGRPKVAATIAITTSLVKLACEYIFLKHLGLGLSSAALSSIAGNIAGICVLIPYFRSAQRSFFFVPIDKSYLSLLRPVFLCGLPKALNQVLSFARTLILNMLILTAIGVEGAAAMIVCLIAMFLTTSFIAGTNDSLLPIVGTLFGEKDYKGITYAMHSGFKILLISSLVFTAIFLIFPQEIGTMFGIKTAAGIAVLTPALRLYALSLPLYGINLMFQNFFQSTGREKLASTIAYLNGFVFVVFFALVIFKISGKWIWLAFFLSELSTLTYVLIKSASIRKKEKVSGFLLLDSHGQQTQWEASIPATQEAAVGVSKSVIDFCTKNNINHNSANRLGVIVEEMVLSTILYAHPKVRCQDGNIDICLRTKDNTLIISFRDDGATFDPTAYKKETATLPATESIDVLCSISREILYTRQLGFNSTVIIIPCENLLVKPEALEHIKETN